MPHSRVVADLHREDLAQAGIGDGRRAFELNLPLPLSRKVRNVVEVMRASDGAQVFGSPCVLEPTEGVPPAAVPAADGVTVVEPPQDGGQPLQGYIDQVSRRRLSGWVRDPELPDEPVSLLISADGKLLARVLASRARPDLKAAGLGNGRSGFSVELVPQLSPAERHIVEVRRERDGAHIPGSPLSLEPETAFTDEFRGFAEALVTSADSDEAVLDRVTYLLRQVEMLQRQRVERRATPVHVRRRRWQEAQHRWQGGPEPEPAAAAPLELPRALVVDYTAPAPDRDAGSNAITSHLLSLRRLGFAVSFIGADLRPAPESLEAAGIDCCGPPWYNSVEELLRREGGCFDLVYLHRYPVATRYLHMVRHYQPQARLVYSLADLHFLREKRQAELEQDQAKQAAAARTQLIELLSISLADRVITHSSFEAAQLKRQAPKAKVHVVPWAIQPRPTAVPFGRRRGIAFIGGYSHAPNLDAARWLVQEIVPALRARDPGFECLLVGSDMPEVLRRPQPGVVALGQVQNLAEVFDRVRLTVAPLGFGAGIKGKVLDSYAAGIPCVCTSVAAEGLDLPPLLQAQVADDVAGLVELIARLHNDAALNATTARAGLEYVQTRLSEARVDSLLGEAVGAASLLAEPGRVAARG